MTLRIEAEIEGLGQFRRLLRNLDDDARRQLQEAVDESGEAVRDSAVRAILHGEKTGRVYTRGSVRHQASAPGEAPASDTGNLVANLVVDGSIEPLEVAVVSGAPQSERLEYEMDRAFLRPALLENEDSIVARVRGVLQRLSRRRR